jgi:hypothetical protein
MVFMFTKLNFKLGKPIWERGERIDPGEAVKWIEVKYFRALMLAGFVTEGMLLLRLKLH